MLGESQHKLDQRILKNDVPNISCDHQTKNWQHQLVYNVFSTFYMAVYHSLIYSYMAN